MSLMYTMTKRFNWILDHIVSATCELFQDRWYKGKWFLSLDIKGSVTDVFEEHSTPH